MEEKLYYSMFEVWLTRGEIERILNGEKIIRSKRDFVDFTTHKIVIQLKESKINIRSLTT
jgi:hypothetical protein